MTNVSRLTIGGLFLLALVLHSRPAFAQMDLSGEWAVVRAEDNTGNTQLGDWVGIPMNDASRARSAAWDASIQTLPEWQCRPHGSAYISRGPSQLKIYKEVDPVSRETTAWHLEWLRSVDRPVYMDGRPHPSPNAPHTWAGFSTARFDGNTLVITTTHLKESYIRANTALFSEKAKVTEWLTLDGDIMTVTTYLDDPAYMEEPHVQSISFRRNVHQELPFFPCTIGVENVQEGFPHFLPGKNPYIEDAAKKQGIPVEAIKGGAATMYPEYREKLKTLPVPPKASN